MERWRSVRRPWRRLLPDRAAPPPGPRPVTVSRVRSAKVASDQANARPSFVREAGDVSGDRLTGYRRRGAMRSPVPLPSRGLTVQPQITTTTDRPAQTLDAFVSYARV